MGNCLVHQEKMLNEVMSMDGETLKDLKMPVEETAEGVIRIKLVLTRQELKDMLQKEAFSQGEMLSLLQREERTSANEKERSLEWKPTLERIPEECSSSNSLAEETYSTYM